MKATLAFGLVLGAAACFVARPVAVAETVRCNYAQLLVNDLLRSHVEIMAAAIGAPPPGASASVIIASNLPELGRPAVGEFWPMNAERPLVRPAQDGGRCEVSLPLRDSLGRAVGVLRLSFKRAENQRASAFAEAAVTLRNQLQRFIPQAEALFDPYVLGSSADDTLAQRLTMEALARHPDMNVVAMHVTPPGERINKVIAINRPNFLGRDSDEIDTDTEKTGRIVMQVIPKTHRLEVHMPMVAVDGGIVGTLCTVGLWQEESQAVDFLARSLALRDELRPQIPSHAALFKP